MMNPYGIDTTQSEAHVLDRTDCKNCIHHDVCIYRIGKKEPEIRRRRVHVFGTIVTMKECMHFVRR